MGTTKTPQSPYEIGYEDGVEYAKDPKSNVQRINLYCRLNKKQAQEYDIGWADGFNSIVSKEVKVCH